MRTLLCWALIAWAAAPNTGAWAESPAADADDATDTDATRSEDAAPAAPDAADLDGDAAAHEGELADTEDADALGGGDADAAPADDAATAGAADDSPLEAGERCLAEPVEVRRFGAADEHVSLSLTSCDGSPNLDALAALSALAQPLPQPGRALPDAPAAVLDSSRTTMQLNAGLLVRLQRLAEHFPGHGFEIVSGYRPYARPGSRHHSGDALDLRIDDVDNLELSEFARSLEATGVGYYPNSTFVHVDVRASEAYWVDRSGPGERPDYGPWPRTDQTAEAELTKSEKAADETVAADASDADEQSAGDASDTELKALADRALVIMDLAQASARTALPDHDAP